MISIKQIYSNILRNPMFKDTTLEQVIDYAFEFMRIVEVDKGFIEKEEEVEIDRYRGLLPSDYHKYLAIYKEGIPMLPRTSTSHSKEGNTFKIVGNIIFTSFDKGSITLRYLAVGLDADGFPTIPDDARYIRALEAYIRMKLLEIEFYTGKINGNVIQDARQQYAWAVGQVQAGTFSVADMEALKNGLYSSDDRFKNDFR